jgi:hypothetical protein
MAANHKLTAVIGGRTVQSSGLQDSLLSISFTDGSIMQVKAGSPAAEPPAGATIDSVRQRGTSLTLALKDGASVEITTQEETSSVMVRDASGGLEYAD